MRCLIILNARDSDKDGGFYRELAENSDIIICADGGVNLAVKIGIEPDILIGDLDSADPELLSSLESEIIRYPADKDRTDGWLALRKAVEMGCDEIVITNAISDRIDHTLANIQMMLSVDADVIISEPDMELRVMDDRRKILKIHGKTGDRVSLIPISERVDGISLKGLKYAVENASFSIRDMNGISNEMVSESAEIGIKNGILMVVHYR